MTEPEIAAFLDAPEPPEWEADARRLHRVANQARRRAKGPLSLTDIVARWPKAVAINAGGGNRWNKLGAVFSNKTPEERAAETAREYDEARPKSESHEGRVIRGTRSLGG